MMRWLPLVLFAALGGVLGWGLFREDRDALPSVFVDRQAPAFSIPRYEGEAPLTAADLKGEGVTVLNFWASWCAPCRVEHPKLMELAAMDGVRVIGLNYDTDREQIERFLEQLGDPFEAVGLDKRSRVKIEYGVAGLPETFVLNAEGRIVYKHPGPINPGEMESRILPAVERARGG